MGGRDTRLPFVFVRSLPGTIITTHKASVLPTAQQDNRLITGIQQFILPRANRSTRLQISTLETFTIMQKESDYIVRKFQTYKTEAAAHTKRRPT